MIIVIIAGGSGTRLWPLSTPEYPKHLLKINGSDRSLVQNTFDRAFKVTDKIYVVSEAGHIQHVKDQLPELSDDKFIVEPARRGTASCIVAALSHIAKSHDKDEPIAYIAADHYVRDIEGFRYSLKTAEKVSREQNRIVLVGVEPESAATGFGYIEKGDIINDDSYVYDVKSFKEKPNFETALKYLRSGNYLWNCSYFVGSVNVFNQATREFAPELLSNYDRLSNSTEAEYEQTYLSFENISIDYALIEKVKNLLVVPASFDWMDLGSFGDMHKAVGENEQGNHITGSVETEEVENSFIQNYEDKPLAVIGLDNVVVINTANGVLVVRKDLSQKVGEVSKRLI